MTHREVLEALSGLLLAMFVAMVSSTIVTNALPRIVADLEGTQTGYTWVVVATLLTMTATTPIWGKLADLFSKKMLVQSALVIYSAGSLVAAFAPSMSVLIGARAFQGLGVGGLTALVQVVIASMVSPRERGRYSGYIGAVFALATVSGPLIGGLIVDSPLGWRGCFFAPLPIALAAYVVLQRRLKLPVVKRDVSIDWAGATLIVGGVSILLVWVSLAGSSFDWVSATTALLLGVGVLVIAAAVYVEARVAREPVIPLKLFKDRTIVLATLASAMIGLAMFGSTVYLSQYFQLSRGMSPTEAGLMSVAMVGGLLVSSITTGRIITASGRWKRYLVGGSALVVVGFSLLGTIDHTTNLVQVGAYMALVGLGIGATMQNLVLAVQNNTRQADMGAASATVSFFRSMGGAVGVSALGAVLAHQVRDSLAAGLERLGVSGVRNRRRLHPRRGLASGAGAEPLRDRLRRGHRPHLPDLGALRAGRLRLHPLHPGGAAAHHPRRRGGRRIDHPGPGRPREGVSAMGAGSPGDVGTDERSDAVHRLEQEVGVLLRRVRRSVGERARLVHADLHPSAYFLLAHVAEHGPVRASALVEAMDLDKGAVSRRVQHLVDLGLVDRTPDPADGRATLVAVSREGRTRLADMAEHRRQAPRRAALRLVRRRADRLRLRARPLQRHPLLTRPGASAGFSRYAGKLALPMASGAWEAPDCRGEYDVRRPGRAFSERLASVLP